MIKDLFKKITRFFTVNLGTKLMALLLAIFVWFYIQQEYTERSTSIEVPLKLETPAGVIAQAEDLKNKPVNSVRIVLEGPQRAIDEISSDLTCHHKVAMTKLSPQSIPQIEDIKESDFKLPPSLIIRKIDPPQIKVSLMKESKKYLKVETEKCWRGNPAKGYRLISVKSEPKEVLVRGPENILKNLNSIPCAPIDISSATSSFSQIGKIVPYINNKPVFTDDSFKLVVNISEEYGKIIIRTKINILIPPDFIYQAKTKPEEIEMTFEGPLESIKSLKKSQFTVFVDITNIYTNISDLKPGTYSSNLVFKLNENAPKEIKLAEPLRPIRIEIY